MLEIIAFTVVGCEQIQAAGAHRIELCDNPMEGGTTPSYGFIKAAREKLSIQLFPIIRPRGGDFLYSGEEYNCIKADIAVCKELGCDGVVVGILTADGEVDEYRCAKLVQLAYPLSVTFHRAFDRVKDPVKSLETIINCGFERILTSGLHPNVVDGISTLQQLIQQADERIIIMPGSGVRADNIEIIAQKTGAKEFHSSARMKIPSGMNYTNPQMKESLESYAVDQNEIQMMLEKLQKNHSEL